MKKSLHTLAYLLVLGLCASMLSCQTNSNQDNDSLKDSIDSNTIKTDTVTNKPVESLIQQDSLDVNNREIREQ